MDNKIAEHIKGKGENKVVERHILRFFKQCLENLQFVFRGRIMPYY
jgi:hypothetical protein